MLKDSLDALKKKEFVDREDLFEGLHTSLQKLLDDRDYFEVATIYGMGGIGKTRFLREFECLIKRDGAKETELIYTTLEKDNDTMLSSLLRIRKSIPRSCDLFDYAIAALADRQFVYKIDDRFLETIKKNLLTDILSFAAGASPLPVPDANTTIDLLDRCIEKLRGVQINRKYGDTVDMLLQLSNTDPKELRHLLPELLGHDLRQIAEGKSLVVILDSCCAGCDSHWISRMLCEAERGVFVLTSRDQLHLEGINVTLYHMQEIPQPEAEKYLKRYIKEDQYQSELIPQLIEATECIPLYLDMAISVYLNSTGKSQAMLKDELYFRNKEDLTRKFLDHLPEAQQEAILTLAVMGVFNEDLFDHLVSDLNLSASKLDYVDLCNISLVEPLNQDKTLNTFHSLFQRNVSKIIPDQKKHKILHSYLTFLSKRGIYNTEDTVRIFFINTIQFIVDNGFELTVEENEEILDVFFSLHDQRLDFSIRDQKIHESPNRTLLCFLSAASCLHSNLSDCVSEMEQIETTIDRLGKHRNSHLAIKYYSLCIQGQYSEAKSKLTVACSALSPDGVMDWYYGKLKIYLADCLMLTGAFQDAIRQFEEYRNEILGYRDVKENDIFETQKQEGHCYRFNFLLEKAAQIYSDLYDDYSQWPVLKSYCLTTLCETRCFFEPEYVIYHAREAVKLAGEVGQARSAAKIKYATGIAYCVKRDFSQARRYILESIQENEACGYPSGKLFALIAQCYCCYAEQGSIEEKLVAEVKALSSQLQVYGYLLLPVYLMRRDEHAVSNLQKQYQWLDWDGTRKKYEQFIRSLSD